MSMSETTAHEFTFEGLDGNSLPLDAYRGRAMLVVNTATECGFARQFEDLQALWERLQDDPFVLIGVPSNDFLEQEPRNGREIKDYCSVRYGITFPLTEKVKVTGADAHPFYRWAGECAGVMRRPRWNFHKYLIDGEGRFAGWFSTITSPRAPRVLRTIEKLIA